MPVFYAETAYMLWGGQTEDGEDTYYLRMKLNAGKTLVAGTWGLFFEHVSDDPDNNPEFAQDAVGIIGTTDGSGTWTT